MTLMPPPVKPPCLMSKGETTSWSSWTASRLMGWVSEERWRVVEAAGDSAKPDYLVQANGELRRLDGGAAAVSGRMPGKWVRVAGFDQAGGDAGSARTVLITRAVWEAGSIWGGWERA